MDGKIRRTLIRPLRKGIVDRKTLVAAIAHLDDRALGAEVLSQLRATTSELGSKGKSGAWKDPDKAWKFAALVRALYESGSFSTQQYVYFATSAVRGVHEGRWIDGHYDSDLEPIHAAMNKIEERHGLNEDQYWPIGEAPSEYQRLERLYTAALDHHFLLLLRDFSLNDLADWFEANPNEFEEAEERGRRSVFHKNETVLALRDIVLRFQEDARKAASVKAYSAAVTLLGAGVEGSLLLRCFRSKHKAQKFAKNLPKRQRPRSPEDPTTWSFDTLIEVCFRAGWLPPVSTSVAVYNPERLAHVLRHMRNMVHPGKYVRTKPWIETDYRDYKDAEAIFLVLLSRLRLGASKAVWPDDLGQGG